MIKVQITGYEDFVKSAGRMNTDEHLNKAIKKSIIHLEGGAIRTTPVDTGNLRNSYVTKFGYLEGTLENSRKYGIYLHEGTRPHYAPLKALEPWARRHGIPAIFVQRSIAKKGTKGNPWLKVLAENENDKVEAYFSNEMNNLLKKLQG